MNIGNPFLIFFSFTVGDTPPRPQSPQGKLVEQKKGFQFSFRHLCMILKKVDTYQRSDLFHRSHEVPSNRKRHKRKDKTIRIGRVRNPR